MRISINLATRPFVELRPLFARLRLAMAALALTAVGLGIGLHLLEVRESAAQAQMDALNAQTAAVEAERSANEARMREPQNRAVLDRSRFLNTLFTEKSFSWTSVMMDLERVLPAGVQVTSIDPEMTPEHELNIRLRVSGPRELDIDLLRNLERSQRFVLPRPANETAQTQEPGRLVSGAPGVPNGVAFDILSGYNPLPAAVKGPAAQGDKENKSGAAAPGFKAVWAAGPAKSSGKNAGAAGKAKRPPVAAASPKRSKPSANGGGR